MEQGFIGILQKLIDEQGKETLLDASKCKGFLADYTKNEFKKESRFLLQAINAGVQRAIDASRELPVCKKQQIRLLREDYGLDEKIAADVVDTLAFVLRGDTAGTEMQGTDNVPDAIQPAQKRPSAPAAVPAAPGVEPLVKRGYLFLEDADWKQADTYFDRVLDMDPEYAPAYAGKLCCELKVREEEQLAQNEKPLAGYGHYQKAVRFADAEYREKLERYNKTIQDRIEEEERLKRAEKERQAAAKAEQEKREAEERERLAKEKAEREARAEQAERERKAKEKAEREARAAEAAKQLLKTRELIAKYKVCISAGYAHTVGLKTDGMVVVVGRNDKGQCKVSDWRDIIAVAAGDHHTVGIKADGTVVADGDNKYGQCDVSGWRDIVAVTDGVGLKADGTVVGYSDWHDIVAVAADWTHTVGLKADGTVVAVGNNEYGQCDVSDWRDIVAVAVNWTHTVGLKADGTVVAVGANETYDSAAALDKNTAGSRWLRTIYCGQCNVSGWRDIVAVAAGGSCTVGLKADGTVVAVGKNKDFHGNGTGQCNVSGWRDIVAVAAGHNYTVGLKADGTVVAVGNNEYGQCNVSGWRDIGPVSEEQAKELAERLEREREERQRISVEKEKAKKKEWIEHLERERQAKTERDARAAEQQRWQEQGLCKFCGGQLGGLFTKKCKSCGKENR